MYIAIIFYLKVQLEETAEKTDIERVEYDLGYAQYHLMKKFEANKIEAIKYDEEVCHAYEKCILKYLFLIQVHTAKQDEELQNIKNAVLSMTDTTLIKLNYVNRLSNYKTIVELPSDDLRERLKYYTVEPSAVGTPVDSA